MASASSPVAEFSCHVAGQSGILRLTTQRLTLLVSGQEAWACELQEVTQILRLEPRSGNSGGLVGLVLITRSPAFSAGLGTASPILDYTGRFPAIRVAPQTSSVLGRVILQMSSGQPADLATESVLNRLNTSLGCHETILRQYSLGSGTGVCLTKSRIIFQKTSASGYDRKALAMIAPSGFVTDRELGRSLSWEIFHSDLRGLEQHSFSCGNKVLRYLLPVTASRAGDTEHVRRSTFKDSVTIYSSRRGDSHSFNWSEWWQMAGRSGALRYLQGPPRPAWEEGDNEQWFGELTFPVTGADGDAMWYELGPRLAALWGSSEPSSGHVTDSMLPRLGKVVKEFEVPAPEQALSHSGRVIIYRDAVTLLRQAAVGKLAITSIWHIFLKEKVIPRAAVTHVSVITKNLVSFRFAMFMILAIAVILYTAPRSAVLLLVLGFLLWKAWPQWPWKLSKILRRRKGVGAETPALCLTTDAPSGMRSALAETKFGTETLPQIPLLYLGVPSLPALAVQEYSGRILADAIDEVLEELKIPNAS